jgi:hypothetical protein
MTSIRSNPNPNPNPCAGHTAESFPKPGCSAPESSPERGDWGARPRPAEPAADPLKDPFSVNARHSGNARNAYARQENDLRAQINPGGLLHELNLAIDDLLKAGQAGNAPSAPEREAWAEAAKQLRVVQWSLDVARPSASSITPDSADGRAWRFGQPTHHLDIRNAMKFVATLAYRGDLPGIPDDLARKAEDKAEAPPSPDRLVGRYETLEFVRRMANKCALLAGRPADPVPAGYRPADTATGPLDLPGWTARVLDGMANIKPFGGMDPDNPQIAPKLTENQFRLKLALEDVYELKDWKNKTAGRPEFAPYSIDHEIQRALIYAVSVTRDFQTQKYDTRLHDNSPTRFQALNKTFGTDVGDSNALADMARLQPVLDKTNRLLVGYHQAFKKMVQDVDALPFTCYAFGQKGRLAYSAALVEHNGIAQSVNDVRKYQARMNDSDPERRVGSLHDMAKAMTFLQRRLQAPELQKMHATINFSPRVDEKLPGQDEDYCNASPPIQPLDLIPNLPGAADAPELRKLNESINAELRRMTAH